MKPYLANRIKLLAALALLLSIAAWLGSATYYFELTSHFRLHYLLLALLCMVAFVWAKSWKWVAISLLAAGINLPALIPAFLPSAQATDTRASLRIVMANVNHSNQHYADFMATALKQKPELIIVLEATPKWAKALKPLETDYPHTVKLPQNSPFGMLLFSKIALDSERVIEFGGGKHPSLLVHMTINNRKLDIVVTHPVPPINGELFDLRNRQLDDAAALIARIKGARILVGDLNTTQWSPYFSALAKRGALRNGRNGFGVLPTWPTSLPGLMIPIDHLLVSAEVSVKELSTGDDIGSDHLPLIAEVMF